MRTKRLMRGEKGARTNEIFGEGGAGEARGLRHADDVAFGLHELVESRVPLLEAKEKGIGGDVLLFLHRVHLPGAPFVRSLPA
jgi:hypothetical protein